MTERKKTQYVKPLLTIAVPIILSNIISQVQMLIDRAFLGHMDKMYMSALSNVSSPVWTTMSFCFSIVIGASIMISQRVGAGEKEKTHEYAASMLKWNNVIPVLLFLFWMFFSGPVFRAMGVSDNLMPMCLEYVRFFAPVFLVVGLEASSMVIMQTSNYTKPLIWYGVVRAGLNIFLDWVLIFGNLGFPELGIKGASIATLIAEYAGFAYAWYIFMTSKKLHTRPYVREVMSAKLKPFITSAKLGLNTALEDFAWNLGNLMLIRILNSIDEMAAGIYTIVFSVELLAVVVVGALGQGTLTLSSEAVGKKDKQGYIGVCLTAYIFSAAIALVLLIVCLIFPEGIVRIFTNEESIIAVCSTYLILMCLNLYGKFANIIIGNGIRGSGNTIWMFCTQIFGTVFVVGCAMVFVKVFHLGITGVFLAVIADELVRAAVNIAKYIRVTRDMKNNGAEKKQVCQEIG